MFFVHDFIVWSGIATVDRTSTCGETWSMEPGFAASAMQYQRTTVHFGPVGISPVPGPPVVKRAPASWYLTGNDIGYNTLSGGSLFHRPPVVLRSVEHHGWLGTGRPPVRTPGICHCPTLS